MLSVPKTFRSPNANAPTRLLSGYDIADSFGLNKEVRSGEYVYCDAGRVPLLEASAPDCAKKIPALGDTPLIGAVTAWPSAAATAKRLISRLKGLEFVLNNGETAEYERSLFRMANLR